MYHGAYFTAMKLLDAFQFGEIAHVSSLSPCTRHDYLHETQPNALRLASAANRSFLSYRADA
jgi:hypothetical protein